VIASVYAACRPVGRSNLNRPLIVISLASDHPLLIPYLVCYSVVRFLHRPVTAEYELFSALLFSYLV